MSIKTDQAIAKLTEEAMAINNNFAILIEEHLTKICVSDTVADKILAGKSLQDFCKDCEKEARERARKQGSGFQIAGFPDEEYYRMAEDYYGIKEEDLQASEAPRQNAVIDIFDYM